MSERRSGFRGYIASRAVRGLRYPQRIQNLVVRDYTVGRMLTYKLSATEYAMPGCYMILEHLLQELPKIEGIVAFSAFMLPQRRSRRLLVYERVLEAGAKFHAALENIVVSSAADIESVEDMLLVAAALAHAPGRGSIDKVAGMAGSPDAEFWQALASGFE